MSDLDLTNEAPDFGGRQLVERPYDPLKARDSARAKIAYFLLTIATLLIIMAFAAYGLGHPINEVKDLFGLFFTPVIGLLGAVIGFYFGLEKGKH